MSAADDIIDFPELQRLTEYKSAAAIERCLEKQGIRVFWGKRGVFTTREILNAAGGVGGEAANNNIDAEFEDETR